MKIKPYELSPGVSQVKRQEKVLPYSVTPIGDINTWKAERAKIDAEWQAGRNERVANVQGALQSGQVDTAGAFALDAALKQEKASYDNMGETKSARFKPDVEKGARIDAEIEATKREAEAQAKHERKLSTRIKRAAAKLIQNSFPE